MRDPGIPQAAGVVGKIFAADVHKELVRLHHVDDLDLVILRQLAGYAAVAAAQHQHPADVGMNGHGYVDDHLVVGELVLFREDDAAVGSQEAAELRRVKNVDALKIALPVKELLLHTDAELDVVCVQFTEPEVHILHTITPS